MEKSQPSTTLYQVISALFCMIVVVSNIISIKLFKLPFFEDFSIPAGLLTYPLTFLISDLVTEVYGQKKSKLMVYTALGTAVLSYLIIEAAIHLPTNNPTDQAAIQKVLGLNGIIIFSSLTAYVLAQIIDIKLYAWIKKWTGERHLWLRNNASTLISQIIDTFAVNIIFLYYGLGLDFTYVSQIMLFSYWYKAFFSVANTPLFYLLVILVKSNRLTSNTIFHEYMLRKNEALSEQNKPSVP